jgi:hypothetical protein
MSPIVRREVLSQMVSIVDLWATTLLIGIGSWNYVTRPKNEQRRATRRLFHFWRRRRDYQITEQTLGRSVDRDGVTRAGWASNQHPAAHPFRWLARQDG